MESRIASPSVRTKEVQYSTADCNRQNRIMRESLEEKCILNRRDYGEQTQLFRHEHAIHTCFSIYS